MIKHFPILNTDSIAKFYSDKDEVPVKYVCTTELGQSDTPVDIFYRDTPHPKFGNRYFSIGYFPATDEYMISNADIIEGTTFGTVEDNDGNLQYSQYRHDYKTFDNGNMIDGGRSYIRHSGNMKVYVVRDGQMVPE